MIGSIAQLVHLYISNSVCVHSWSLHAIREQNEAENRVVLFYGSKPLLADRTSLHTGVSRINHSMNPAVYHATLCWSQTTTRPMTLTSLRPMTLTSLRPMTSTSLRPMTLTLTPAHQKRLLGLSFDHCMDSSRSTALP